MKASELISDTLPDVHPDDRVGQVLHWMEESMVKHLPLLTDNRLDGIIFEEDLIVADPNLPIKDLKKSRPFTFVLSHHHFFDAAKMLFETKLTILPVLDQQNNYIGSLSIHEILDAYNRTTNVVEPGAVLVLEMLQKDYSLLQIANIVEGNDGKILSSYVTNKSDGQTIEVTLKLNKTRMEGILQTLARYNYNVTEKYQESEYDQLMKERYDELMNYLNM